MDIFDLSTGKPSELGFKIKEGSAGVVVVAFFLDKEALRKYYTLSKKGVCSGNELLEIVGGVKDSRDAFTSASIRFDVPVSGRIVLKHQE